MKRLTTKQFKEKYIRKYGNIYNLDKVDYKNNKTEVIIICPEHGEFKKRPDCLMDGGKCPKCSETNKMTEEEFIKKANYVHNNFFTYENCGFINVSSKVKVTCPLHGEWYPKANNHLNGMNCPKCSKDGFTHEITKIETQKNSTKTYTTEEFIKKSIEIHGDLYTYENANYVKNNIPLIVTCKIHGDFSITPNHFLSGRGCPKCAGNAKMNTKDFIEKANEIHFNKYSYKKTEYVRTHDKVIITCPIHGDFLMTPANHLKGQNCPMCEESKLENEIRQFLIDNKIEYIYEYHGFLGKQSLDFYLPYYNVGIECQGIQHFKPTDFAGKGEKWAKALFNETQKRDEKKNKLCKENNVKLFYYSDLEIKFPYKVYNNKVKLLKEITNEC